MATAKKVVVEAPDSISGVTKEVIKQRKEAGDSLKSADIIADLSARYPTVEVEKWTSAVSNAKTALRNAGELPPSNRKPRGSNKAATNGDLSVEDLIQIREQANQTKGGLETVTAQVEELNELVVSVGGWDRLMAGIAKLKRLID